MGAALALLALSAMRPSAGLPQRMALPPVPATQTGASPHAAELLARDDGLFTAAGRFLDRRPLLRSLDFSIRYLRGRSARARYARQYAHTGITHERALRSLLRFRQLLIRARSAADLGASVGREFDLVEPGGSRQVPDVLFTGYFEPLYEASRVPSARYRYPLYRAPRGRGWARLSRAELEGIDGLGGSRGPLRGHAIVWLKDRLEAFLVHVEGSARLRLPGGRTMTVASTSHNDWPYTSIGQELVRDGKIPREELNGPNLLAYFRAHPEDLSVYLPRNRRFICFRETSGAPPRGALGMALTPERSMATDKAVLPAGALALAEVPFVQPAAIQEYGAPTLVRLVLDQDTGVAIKGQKRVDLYMGTGPRAGVRAGVINALGRLYYLLLKEPARRSARGRAGS